MNPPSQLPPEDAWLEQTLRERHTDDYIDDAGFTTGVVSRLPTPSHRRTWLLGGAAVIGVVIAAWFAGPAVAELRAGAGPAVQFFTRPADAVYSLVGTSMLLAAGSTWWALTRRRRRHS